MAKPSFTADGFNKACKMKLFLVIALLLFLHPVNAADIQIGNNKPEVQIRDWRLEIICPKCGYIFYDCDVPEIFKNDTEQFIAKHCIPHTPKVPIIAVGAQPFCLFDYSQPFVNNIQDSVIGSNGQTSSFFTNKGWMPQRDRPSWQE